MIITERRTRAAIAADLRECAMIWRKRAEQCFGNRLAIDRFNHAVMCAQRFEAQLHELAPENATAPENRKDHAPLTLVRASSE